MKFLSKPTLIPIFLTALFLMQSAYALKGFQALNLFGFGTFKGRTITLTFEPDEAAFIFSENSQAQISEGAGHLLYILQPYSYTPYHYEMLTKIVGTVPWPVLFSFSIWLYQNPSNPSPGFYTRVFPYFSFSPSDPIFGSLAGNTFTFKNFLILKQNNKVMRIIFHRVAHDSASIEIAIDLQETENNTFVVQGIYFIENGTVTGGFQTEEYKLLLENKPDHTDKPDGAPRPPEAQQPPESEDSRDNKKGEGNSTNKNSLIFNSAGSSGYSCQKAMDCFTEIHIISPSAGFLYKESWN